MSVLPALPPPLASHWLISTSLPLSRGFKDAASSMSSDLEAALMAASEGGKLPIVVDTSPCMGQLKGQVSEPALKFALYEPVEFIRSVDWGSVTGRLAP